MAISFSFCFSASDRGVPWLSCPARCSACLARSFSFCSAAWRLAGSVDFKSSASCLASCLACSRASLPIIWSSLSRAVCCFFGSPEARSLAACSISFGIDLLLALASASGLCGLFRRLLLLVGLWLGLRVVGFSGGLRLGAFGFRVGRGLSGVLRSAPPRRAVAFRRPLGSCPAQSRSEAVCSPLDRSVWPFGPRLGALPVSTDRRPCPLWVVPGPRVVSGFGSAARLASLVRAGPEKRLVAAAELESVGFISPGVRAPSTAWGSVSPDLGCGRSWAGTLPAAGGGFGESPVASEPGFGCCGLPSFDFGSGFVSDGFGCSRLPAGLDSADGWPIGWPCGSVGCPVFCTCPSGVGWLVGFLSAGGLGRLRLVGVLIAKRRRAADSAAQSLSERLEPAARPCSDRSVVG